MIDFIMERCWDKLGFEALEEACEKPTLRILQTFLISYYDHLTTGEHMCLRCQTIFSRSSFIKLVGIPRLQPSEPYKVFLVHRYYIEGDIRKEIICYSSNEEKFYYTGDDWRLERRARIKEAMLGNHRNTSARHTKVIPIATIAPLCRNHLHDSYSHTNNTNRVFMLCKKHRQNRVMRNYGFWRPAVIEELGEDWSRTNTNEESWDSIHIRKTDWNCNLIPHPPTPKSRLNSQAVSSFVNEKKTTESCVSGKTTNIAHPDVVINMTYTCNNIEESNAFSSSTQMSCNSLSSPIYSSGLRPPQCITSRKKQRDIEKKPLTPQSKQTFQRCLPPIGVSKIPVPSYGFPAQFKKEEPPPKLPDIPEDIADGSVNVFIPRVIKPLPDWSELSKIGVDRPHLSRIYLDRPSYDFMKPNAVSMKRMCSKTYIEKELQNAADESEFEQTVDDFLKVPTGNRLWDQGISNSFMRSIGNIALSRSSENICLPDRSSLRAQNNRLSNNRRKSRSCSDLSNKGKTVCLADVSRDVQDILIHKLHQRKNDCLMSCNNECN